MRKPADENQLLKNKDSKSQEQCKRLQWCSITQKSVKRKECRKNMGSGFSNSVSFEIQQSTYNIKTLNSIFPDLVCPSPLQRPYFHWFQKLLLQFTSKRIELQNIYYFLIEKNTMRVQTIILLAFLLFCINCETIVEVDPATLTYGGTTDPDKIYKTSIESPEFDDIDLVQLESEDFLLQVKQAMAKAAGASKVSVLMDVDQSGNTTPV